MPTNYRGLAFLLSIGSLPFACTKDNDDTDSGGSTTTPGTSPTGTTGTGSDTTDPTTGSSMSSDPTTTGNSASGTTTATTTGTTEPEPTTFLTTNTETGFETDEPPPPPTDPTCIAYGQHVVECIPRYAGYQDYIAGGCESYKAYALRADGQACVDALEAMYVCLSKVDCAEFMDPGMPPPSCANEIAAIDIACPSLNDPGMTTGGSNSDGSSGG